MTNEARKILVTGAGSGLGLRFSIELAKRGHRVIGAVHLHSQMNCLEEAAKEAGVTVSVIKADITDPVDRAYLARHDVDILVNNAGIGEGGALADMPMPVLAVSSRSTILQQWRSHTPSSVALQRGNEGGSFSSAPLLASSQAPSRVPTVPPNMLWKPQPAAFAMN